MIIQIITLNCFALPLLGKFVKERLSCLSREINKISPDAVCFQEVFLREHIDILRGNLVDFPYVFFEQRKFLQFGGGLVIFSKQPFLQKMFVRFHKQGPVLGPAFSDRIAGKGFLFVETPIFFLINTHFLANYDSDYSPQNKFAKAQSLQLNQLMEFVQSNKLEAKPLILAGDFNFRPKTFLYKRLTEKLGVIDLGSGEASTLASERLYLISSKIKSKERLDYIFWSERIPLKRVVSQCLFTAKFSLDSGAETFLSDHFAVSAIVAF